MQLWMTIAELNYVLREEHRLKVNVDYAVSHKYGHTHLLCDAVFLECITEVANVVGIEFTSVHTYDTRSRT